MLSIGIVIVYFIPIFVITGKIVRTIFGTVFLRYRILSVIRLGVIRNRVLISILLISSRYRAFSRSLVG